MFKLTFENGRHGALDNTYVPSNRLLPVLAIAESRHMSEKTENTRELRLS